MVRSPRYWIPCTAHTVSALNPFLPSSPRITFQATPAMPMPLFPTAPRMPEMSVPCPSASNKSVDTCSAGS